MVKGNQVLVLTIFLDNGVVLNLNLIGGPLIINGGRKGEDVQVGVVSFETGGGNGKHIHTEARNPVLFMY